MPKLEIIFNKVCYKECGDDTGVCVCVCLCGTGMAKMAKLPIARGMKRRNVVDFVRDARQGL